MSLPKEISDAIYQAIQHSPLDDKAISEAVDEIYFVMCLMASENLISSLPDASDQDLKDTLDAIFLDFANDINETLKPYNAQVGIWTASSLAKRVQEAS